MPIFLPVKSSTEVHKIIRSAHNVHVPTNEFSATKFSPILFENFLVEQGMGLKLSVHGYLHARKSSTIRYHWEIVDFQLFLPLEWKSKLLQCIEPQTRQCMLLILQS